MNLRFSLRAIAFLSFGILSTTLLVPNSHAADEPALIERGRYLATAADCVACHTGPDAKPFAGGVELKTPFGTIVSPNITPDKDAGIGAWTDDEFVSALWQGRGHNRKR